MSSSRTPRAVALTPRGAPLATRWAPDEISAWPIDPGLSPLLDAEGAAPPVAASPVAIDEAYQRGWAEGHRAGEAAERARIGAAVAALEAAARSIHDESQRWLANLEENVGALAVTVARAMLAREITVDPSVVLATVRAALAEFPIQTPLRVHLHPTDLNRVLGPSPDGQSLASRAHLQWIADDSIVPGGCLVEGRERIVDGRVDTALERMYRRLVDADS